MSGFMDLWRNPNARLAGLVAGADATTRPGGNPFLEFALGARDRFNTDRERQEAERKRLEAERAAAAEKAASESEAKRRQTLQLVSMGLKDRNIRKAITQAYGINPPEWVEADAREERELQEQTSKEAASKAAAAESLRGALDRVPTAQRSAIEALIDGGFLKDAADSLQGYATPPKAPTRDPKEIFRSGPNQSIRQWDPARGEWITAPGGEGETEDSNALAERMILSALKENDRKTYDKRPDAEVIASAIERARLTEKQLGGGSSAPPETAGGDQGLLGKVVSKAAEAGKKLDRATIQALATKNDMSFGEALETLARELGVM